MSGRIVPLVCFKVHGRCGGYHLTVPLRRHPINGRLKYLFILSIVAILAFMPLALQAQDDLTLENLAEQLAALLDRVTALESEIVLTGDGLCVIGNRETIQAQTATKYLEEFDELPGNAKNIRIEGVTYEPGVDIVGIRYREELSLDPFSMARTMDSMQDEPRRVIEYWEGCQYAGSSDWWGE